MAVAVRGVQAYKVGHSMAPEVEQDVVSERSETGERAALVSARRQREAARHSTDDPASRLNRNLGGADDLEVQEAAGPVPPQMRLPVGVPDSVGAL